MAIPNSLQKQIWNRLLDGEMEKFSSLELDPGVVEKEIAERSQKKQFFTILGVMLEVFWKSF